MKRASADRRVLDEARGLRAMTWVMAIMLFLTVLAGALGLGTLSVRAMLASELTGRLTVQVVDGDGPTREATARRIMAALRGVAGVTGASEVDRAELAQLLRPWLGDDAGDPELPIPAMVDVGLARGSTAALDEATAVIRRVAPAARIDRHESWMSPVTSFMTTLAWLAGALVLLMAGATAAVVMLAARAGLETHRATIEVMHMLGSTDRQVARLFQRRIALDAAIGGVGGGLAALGVAAFISSRIGALGSDLLGEASLGPSDWLILAALPVAFVVLATLAARVAVMAALRKTL